MRCRPDDLAFVKRACFEEAIGRVVTVVKLVREGTWLCHSETPLPCQFFGIKVFTQEFEAFDEGLIPIRDPGQDAVDEMLRPLPKKETSDV